MDRDAVGRLADHLDEGLVLLGPRFEVRVCNRSAVRLLRLGGAPPATLREIEERSGLPLVEWVAEAARSGEDVRERELRGAAFGGRALRADLLSVGRARAACLLLVRDSEKAASAASELIGEVAHELRSPLAALRTALELVGGGEAGELSGEQRRLVQIGARSAERMDRLVEALLDLARARGGRLMMRPATMTVAQALLPWLEQTALVAQRGERALQVEVDARATAHVDAERCVQIVDNLVSNALKYTPAHGQVRVAVQGGEPLVDAGLRGLAAALELELRGTSITVLDNGPGMARVTREQAFTRHFRGDDAACSGVGGSGLGLSIAEALVRAHHGSIQLHSTPGRGTQVSVWLPADAPTAAVVAAAQTLEQRLAAVEGVGAEPPLQVAVGARRGALSTEMHPSEADPLADLAGARRAVRSAPENPPEPGRESLPGHPRARWVAPLTDRLGIWLLPAEESGLADPQGAAGDSSGIVASPGARQGPRAAIRPHLGVARFPADGADAGTLLAVAATRARAAWVAGAGDPAAGVPKEDQRERSPQTADRR